MLERDTMGIILTDRKGVSAGDFTGIRSMSALPFAGRYRLIDFTVSCMVNSEINRIAVFPTNEYSSLIDHLGSGKPWDLDRKRKGLSMLIPKNTDMLLTETDIMHGNLRFLEQSAEKYVVVSYGYTVYNNSFREAISFHEKNAADVTLIYHKSPVADPDNIKYSLSAEKNGKINEILIGADKRKKGQKFYCGIAIYNRSFLIQMLEYCYTRNIKDTLAEYILRYISNINAYAYEFKGYFGIINSLKSYYMNNMNMLRQEVRSEIFESKNLVFTKVKDSVPTTYGENAVVSNSLIADGCYIKGKVENSIIARGVKILENSTVRNSIILQNGVIKQGCTVENAIFDKEVKLSEHRNIIGAPSYPFTVHKGAHI